MELIPLLRNWCRFPTVDNAVFPAAAAAQPPISFKTGLNGDFCRFPIFGHAPLCPCLFSVQETAFLSILGSLRITVKSRERSERLAKLLTAPKRNTLRHGCKGVSLHAPMPSGERTSWGLGPQGKVAALPALGEAGFCRTDEVRVHCKFCPLLCNPRRKALRYGLAAYARAARKPRAFAADRMRESFASSFLDSFFN